MSKISRLERYTEQRRQEVLLINAEVNGEPDQIAIFRGFSSSLMRPTIADPDVPVLGDDATILTIDRLQGPLNLENPQYLQRDLTWEMMESLLGEVGA
jgi:hypothetical protein